MTSTTRTRARRGEGALLREEILRAAEDLLAEHGSEDALTIRAVAARAGISTPSVYLHFADKEALLETVCLRVWDELGRLFRENAGGDPFVALGRCGRAYARFALTHPVQYRVLLMRSTPEGPAQAATECFRHMVAVVERCVESGILRGDPERLALTLWSAVHGCVALVLAQPGFPWPDVDELVNQAVIVAGFGSAMLSRVPPEGVPASAELAEDLDTLAERLRNRRPYRKDQASP
ncbi:TetR/AcrR family transcriptional regulator [Nonomuraea typhae]|uniref:TetR/AcrR family transcriptional regulator n=1 Tax=Nonomuraea typhae TaxID=2603600 RepID=UPI0012F92F80|nr:TetR/AcrR family transcriptional regulator [Nonomuraea typhae]